MIRHTSKVQDTYGLKKIEEKDKQFLIEKIIYGIKNENPYIISTEKKPRIMREIEKTYKICRRVYQSLFIDIADIFIEYIQSPDLDEIQQMDNDIKSNGWEVKSLLDIENAFDLLRIFQMFYHFDGRLPLTNGHLVVPAGETPEGIEKISLKDL